MQNFRSAPVHFSMTVRQNNSDILAATHVVEPLQSLDIDITFNAEVGPAEMLLSTRMADGSTPNSYAWAVWRGLELTNSAGVDD